MKKALSMILVLVMLLSLCACGKKDTGATEPTTTPTQASTETEATIANTAATEESTQEATEEPTAAPTGATSEKATVGSTPKATSAPTTKVTAAPTTKATAAPTTKATAATTTKATAAPTTKATAAPTTKATAAPTTKATVAPATKPAAPVATTCSHSYKDATCTAPKTCSKCGATEGSAAGHSYSNGACTVCGTADPNVPFDGNEWAAYIVKAGTSEQGEVLSEYVLRPTKFNGYTHKEYYSNASYSSMNNGSITHNGKTYYDYWFSSEMNGMAWDDFGDTVVIVFAYDAPIIELTLSRTGETQFTVTSSNDTASIPVGTVFKNQ